MKLRIRESETRAPRARCEPCGHTVYFLKLDPRRFIDGFERPALGRARGSANRRSSL